MVFARSLLFNIVMYVSGIIYSLYGHWLRLAAPTQVVNAGILWARFTLGALRLICGINLQVQGREHIPAHGPTLIAAQHQSAFDTLVWLTLLPRPAYVLKRELLKLPLMGSLFLPSGFVAVNRAGGAAALRQLVADCRRAATAQKQIIIFPEGTRVAAGERTTLQPGVVAIANALHLPIIPVTTNSGYFWGRKSFQKFPGTLLVHIHPPLPTATPRTEIISRLTSYFYPEPVDNSVDSASPQFGNQIN